jgi:N-acetyltransferase
MGVVVSDFSPEGQKSWERFVRLPHRRRKQRCAMRRASRRTVLLIGVPFDLQPTLKGELLELRPLRREDFHGLYAVASDPLIWEQHPMSDRYKEDVFKEFFREALESGGALIAIDSKDGRIIGSSRFHGYDKEKSEIEIGWTFLARSHWGGAYNREMKRLMLRHAFQFVDSVIFLVGPQNLRSQRAMEKIGGVRAGSRPDRSGRESFVYRITANQEF